MNMANFLSFLKVYFHKILYQKRKFLVALTLLCLPLLLLSASYFVFYQVYFDDFESRFYDYGTAVVSISSNHSVDFDQYEQYAKDSYQSFYKGHAISISGQVVGNVSIQNLENETDQLTFQHDASTLISLSESFFSSLDLINQTRGVPNFDFFLNGRRPRNSSEIMVIMGVYDTETTTRILQHARVIIQNQNISLEYIIVGYYLVPHTPGSLMGIRMTSLMDTTNPNRISQFIEDQKLN